MPEYRRAFQPGGTFFFTLITYKRYRFLTDDEARRALHRAFAEVQERHPFSMEAVVLLRNHLHCLWTLPEDDANYSLRWQLIKARFTRYYLAAGGTGGPVNASRRRKQERAVWQRRFWEHVVRNEREYEILCNYIHYNPVKHEHAACPHAWPYSSFHRFVAMRRYEADWCCACEQTPRPHNIPDVPSEITGE